MMVDGGDVMTGVAGAVAAVFGGLAFLCWASAFVHWVWVLGHRRPEISLATMLFFGFKSYDSSNFLPSGQKIHRRFLYSIGGFALCVVAIMAVSIVSSSANR
jgi:hypothetical protein